MTKRLSYPLKIALRALPATLWTVFILYLSTQPMPEEALLFEHSDKVLHFGAFALLSILTGFALNWKLPLISIVLMPTITGAVVEYLQSKLPYRSASVWDFIADFAGTIFVFTSFIVYKKLHANCKHRHRN